MIGISLWRVFRAALQNFGRNIWLSLATTIIMVITLLMMSFLYFANVFGVQVLHDVQSKVDLLVTFKEKVSTDYITAFSHEMQSRQDVQSVQVITSEEALNQFRSRHKDDALFEQSLQELEQNPLPASMNITATEPRFYENIASALQDEKYSPYIDKVSYEDTKPVIDKLIRYMNTIQEVSLIVTIAFACLVILIMFNTVRMAIYSFREEIDIMRLVGASRWYIQGPFLLESVFVSLIAVTLTTVLIYVTLNQTSDFLSRFFTSSGTSFSLYGYATQHWFKIIGIELLSSIGLATISSWIGIRRYLRN